MNKIIFTSDLLKVDDRIADKYSNPQEINIDWIYALVKHNAKVVDENAELVKLLGTENGFNSIRWEVFNSLGLPLTSSSWATLYEGNYGLDVISNILRPYFSNAILVVGFELPPYLIKILNNLDIHYIDFTIHPIRFLPDYMLGVRSNIESIQTKLEESKLPDTVINNFATISQARTVRVARNTEIIKGSVLFLGQIEIDSSLIYDGKLASLEEIENALIELSLIYPKVYYKAHPHAKNLSGLKNIISKINKCQWFEMNIYDALAQDSFELIATMSSGGAYEAVYFDKKIKCYLNNVKQQFDYNNENKYEIYYPIYRDILDIGYWKWLFHNTNYRFSIYPDAFQEAIRYTSNMKWGK